MRTRFAVVVVFLFFWCSNFEHTKVRDGTSIIILDPVAKKKGMIESDRSTDCICHTGDQIIDPGIPVTRTGTETGHTQTTTHNKQLGFKKERYPIIIINSW